MKSSMLNLHAQHMGTAWCHSQGSGTLVMQTYIPSRVVGVVTQGMSVDAHVHVMPSFMVHSRMEVTIFSPVDSGRVYTIDPLGRKTYIYICIYIYIYIHLCIDIDIYIYI